MSIIHQDQDRASYIRTLFQVVSIRAGDAGEPVLCNADVEEMLAQVLWDEGLRDIARATLDPDLFDEVVEGHFRQLWIGSLEICARLTPVAGENLIELLRRHLSTEQPVVPFMTTAHETARSTELLARISDLPLSARSNERGKQLLQRFLVERQVSLPISRLVRQSPEGIGFDTRVHLPTDFAELITQAAGEIESIEQRLGAPWDPLLPPTGPPLPTFPVQALQDVLRYWGMAEAEATQTPVDLAAMLALGTVSAAAAKKVEVLVRPGWREPINIYVVVPMEPGNRKSAVFRDATSPLRNYEQRSAERLGPQVRQCQNAVKILEGRIDRLRRNAARAIDREQQERLTADLDATTEELTRLPRIVAPQLLAEDVTVERLEMILSEQNGRIGILSPEGGVLSNLRGRYAQMPQFEVFLKGHPGDDIRVDRVGRPPVFVDRPAITLAVSPQPDVLRGLASVPELRTLGFLARCLFAIPQSRLGYRSSQVTAVPDHVHDAYHFVIATLCGIDAGATRDLTLAPDALSRFEIYMVELEPRLGPRGDLHDIADWAAKLAGAIARLAGVLHLVAQVAAWRGQVPQHHQRQPAFTPWDTPIPVETIEAAIQIGEYLIIHAQAAFALIGGDGHATSSTIGTAMHVVDWMRAGDRRNISQREVHQGLRSRFAKASDVLPVLEVLVEHNVIRPRPTPPSSRQGGRPASPRFDVNPAIFVDGSGW